MPPTVQGPAAPTAPQGPPVQLPPPISAVAAGQIPAVTLRAIDPKQPLDPIQAFATSNLQALSQAGLDFHEFEDLKTAIYNPKLIGVPALVHAEKTGTLDKVAPLVDGKPRIPAQQKAAGAAPEVGKTPKGAELAAVKPQRALQPQAPNLAEAKVPPNRKLQDARLEAMKAPAPDTPGGPIDAIAKRVV